MYFVFYKENEKLKLFESHEFNKKIVFSIILIGTFLLFLLLMRNREIVLKAKKAIEKEQKKYKDLISLANDGIHIIDTQGNIYEANKAFAKMLNYHEEEILKLNVRDFDSKFSKEEITKNIKELMETPKVFDTKHKRKDGTVFDAQISAKGVTINDIDYLYCVSRDITEQKNEFKKLEKFIDLQDNIVIVLDSEKLNFANKRFFEFTGFKNIEQFNSVFDSISNLFVENDRFFHFGKLKEDENWIEHLQKLPHSKRIVGMLMHDYNIHAFAVTINRFEDNYFILSFTDITQTMLNHIQLEDKTIHDKLTNAYNREYFEQNYKSIISEFSSNGNILGVAFLDIDHFKSVNDTYGHDIGDEILKNFVKTILKYSRESDILIRWGGEEFILFLKVQSDESLKRALDHIRNTIEIEEFEAVGHITCSIGASIYIKDEDINHTIKRADEAVYKAKNNGRNRVEIEL